MSMADEAELIVALAGGVGGGCSLAKTPQKDNWVDKAGGGLPPYICQIARAIQRSGKSTSTAISIAVSRVKKWAAGADDVDADTRAKAQKAVAQWEALKARSKGKKTVKATRRDGTEYITLSMDSFNTDIVRRAWNDIEQAYRTAARMAARAAGRDPYELEAPYSYVRELWTDFIIVERDGLPQGQNLLRVPYTVEDGLNVVFGEPHVVVQEYVDLDNDLNEYETAQLSDVLSMSAAPELSVDSEIKRLIALARG